LELLKKLKPSPIYKKLILTIKEKEPLIEKFLDFVLDYDFVKRPSAAQIIKHDFFIGIK